MNFKRKCSNKSHKEEKESQSYCPQCSIYMCSECEKIHENFFSIHKIFKTKSKESEKENNYENIYPIFSGLCTKKKHNNIPLEYYCKNHNFLCCTCCIIKLNSIGHGDHKDCEIVLIKEVENDKKNKVKENLQKLNKLSQEFNNIIESINEIVNKANENKNNLITKVQKIFTTIRDKINQKEDSILKEIDNKYNQKIISKD